MKRVVIMTVMIFLMVSITVAMQDGITLSLQNVLKKDDTNFDKDPLIQIVADSLNIQKSEITSFLTDSKWYATEVITLKTMSQAPLSIPNDFTQRVSSALMAVDPNIFSNVVVTCPLIKYRMTYTKADFNLFDLGVPSKVEIHDLTNAWNFEAGDSNFWDPHLGFATTSDVKDISFTDYSGHGGIDITYTVDGRLGTTVNAPDFRNKLDASIRAQENLKYLFENTISINLPLTYAEVQTINANGRMHVYAEDVVMKEILKLLGIEENTERNLGHIWDTYGDAYGIRLTVKDFGSNSLDSGTEVKIKSKKHFPKMKDQFKENLIKSLNESYFKKLANKKLRIKLEKFYKSEILLLRDCGENIEDFMKKLILETINLDSLEPSSIKILELNERPDSRGFPVIEIIIDYPDDVVLHRLLQGDNLIEFENNLRIKLEKFWPQFNVEIPNIPPGTKGKLVYNNFGNQKCDILDNKSCLHINTTARNKKKYTIHLQLNEPDKFDVTLMINGKEWKTGDNKYSSVAIEDQHIVFKIVSKKETNAPCTNKPSTNNAPNTKEITLIVSGFVVGIILLNVICFCAYRKYAYQKSNQNDNPCDKEEEVNIYII